MDRTIDYWCTQFRLQKYIIRDNGIVDVDEDVDISFNLLEEIPIQFGTIIGDFSCCCNRLISLKGAPSKVNGHFVCYDNKLITLKGSPIHVKEDYDCSENRLVSLEGGPNIIGGNFCCVGNPIDLVYKKYDGYNCYIRSIKIDKILN
jgi:hypothetical protein